jgi:DNA sulfur modification protein DndB
MAFLTHEKVGMIKEKIVTDVAVLGKLYKSKKKEYIEQNVEHNEVEDYLRQGWVKVKELKTKWKIRKEKSHSKLFEDQVWCQFYDLGYRILNKDEKLELPFSKDPKDTKQIDVFAIDVKNKVAFIVECKSSAKKNTKTSYKDEFELLKLRIDGFRKAVQEIYGKDIKVKYIFATRNIRIEEDSIDLKRLRESKAFYFNDNTYSYVNSLIKNYKSAAHYQFLGMIFKNEKINNDRIEIPAIEGKMGDKTYYMFSIEPDLLLKIGFILHRTKANSSEMPTYQRLLIPSRLKGITKFIEEGGYFPNSLIINFSREKKIQFEASSRMSSSESRFGTLKIPNEYAIAYIIDGQHRLYGYANSKYKSTNTVPVVAMYGLDATEQLGIFMDINQNQKAVNPSLRLVLEEDLYWNSDRLDSRLKALKSSIIKELSIHPGPLFNKITIGEDSAELTFKPFYTALSNCSLLPKAKGNEYIEGTTESALYDYNNLDNEKVMRKSKKDVVNFLNKSYDYMEENFPDLYNNEKFIISNRGTYAFIMLIGSLHKFVFDEGIITRQTTIKERFENIEKYLSVLGNGLKNLSTEEKEKYLMMKGSSADTSWFKLFQIIVNKQFPEYEPKDLVDWKERQDKKLQEKAREYIETIEKNMKEKVLANLKELFGDKWELEINSYKRKCLERVEAEKEKQYKEGMPIKDRHWTEMLTIMDYKNLIEKYWTRKVENDKFEPFEKIFSIDIGEDFNSKSDKVKWISYLNSYRNIIAHSATKESGLNHEEVAILEKIYRHFDY